MAPSLLYARPQAPPAPVKPATLVAPAAPSDYNARLAGAINRLIAPVYRTQITLLEQAAQGDFMWYYQNLNQQFNEGTLDFIGANVTPGDLPGTARLSSAGSFQNAWVQILTGTVFTLSTTDIEQTNKSLSAAEVQSQAIVADYQAIWGNIDDTAMDAAKTALPLASIENKFDYITAYVMGYVWSGASQTKAAALTYQQMSRAANLVALLPKAPASARPLITEASRTFALQETAASIQAEQQQGRWMLSQMIANVAGPSAANGGMQTVNPNNGVVSEAYQPGYTVRRSLSSIQNDLANQRRVLRVEIPVSQNPSGPLVKFSTDDNMRGIAGAGEETGVTIEYQGYSLVPIGPTAWQQVSNRGWYYGDPIAQAVKNGSRDVTGFRFVSEPSFNLKPLGEGGDLGFLTDVLISNYPTITVRYKNADLETLKRSLSETQPGNLELFGSVKFGNRVAGGYCADCRAGSSNADVDVVFSQSKELQTVPQMQKTAYVIGVVVANPGVAAGR